MSFHKKIAMRIFGKFLQPYLGFFPDLKDDLKKAGLGMALEEYLSVSALVCIALLIIEIPILSFILSLLGLGFLFSIFMAITISICISAFFLFLFTNYPKFIIRDRARSIDRALPFAGIYLSTIASSNLPPHKIFEIFSKFTEYGEISNEARRIVRDMKAFGLNIYDSLYKAINRTPSNEFRDLLWSILSTLKAGGDLPAYLSEKSKTFLNRYRRSLEEFAHSLTIYLEIYLTALVLGTLFFTILTSIMSGLGGGTKINILFVQFFLIFLFIPLLSFAFIVLIKSASPGGE